MLHGDISNQQSFVIGFRCENSLLKYKDKKVTDKLLNVVKGKTSRAVVDPKVKSLMDYIYWNTEYTIVLIIDKDNYTKEAESFLSDYPYNRVYQVSSVAEITMMLLTGDLTYFVSEDMLDRQRVNNKYAVDVDTFNSILKRRVKRFEES